MKNNDDLSQKLERLEEKLDKGIAFIKEKYEISQEQTKAQLEEIKKQRNVE